VDDLIGESSADELHSSGDSSEVDHDHKPPLLLDRQTVAASGAGGEDDVSTPTHGSGPPPPPYRPLSHEHQPLRRPAPLGREAMIEPHPPIDR